MNLHGPDEPVLLPRGFFWSATTAGIKASGRSDVALVEAPLGASASAMFTRNRVVAAPIEVGRLHLRRSKGRVRAVLVNAGNANCATGAHGIAAAAQSCAALGEALEAAPEFIIPSSTGIIGVPLPVNKLMAAIPAAVEGLADNADALKAFATAIMTTDTRMKLASAEFSVGKKTARIAGVCKGSGMIHPNMATMLVYLFSDIEAEPRALQPLLKAVVDRTFNALSVDGDTSTNDTVLLLASGASTLKLSGDAMVRRFTAALDGVCASLAEQIARDGEGAQHLVRLRIHGAKSQAEARTIAASIANSPLVKTAWAGCDPNWGRMLSSIGKSGIAVDPSRINISIGPFQVCRHGMAHAFDEEAAHEFMQQPEYEIKIELGRGKSSLEFLTCDLTAEYVHINADYST